MKAYEECSVNRLTIVFLILVALFAAIIISVIIFNNSERYVPSTNNCPDNLRSIDSVILEYEAAHGTGMFPERIEDLVPQYLEEVPKEGSGGYYYLDYSSGRPRAACSLGHTY